jgi:hypothetical protein
MAQKGGFSGDPEDAHGHEDDVQLGHLDRMGRIAAG